MAILHFRVTEANEVIKLDRAIQGQNMTLRKIVVIKNDNQTGTPYDFKGGCTISLDFLQGGLEMASNVNQDQISVPFKQEEKVSVINYDLNFESETVDQNFLVSVTNYDRTGTTVPFDPSGTTNNAILYIDLYFDYASLFDYNRY